MGAGQLATSLGLARDVIATLGRAGLGLVFGVVVGVLAGLGTGRLGARQSFADRALAFVRSIPPVVVLPAFLLLFGFNDLARVSTVAFGCAWPMALAVAEVMHTPRSLRREMLDLAGTTRWRARAWTEPWESLPELAVGLKSSASTSVIVAVVCEMVAGSAHGLGSRIVSAQIANDTLSLALSIAVAGGVGYVLNRACEALECRSV